MMNARRYRLILALIFVLAMAVRLWLWYDQGRAWMVFPGDQDEYYRGAIHLVLNRDYYDEGQWLRPPLTSFFFAAAFALFGVNLPLALLLQCLLGATHPLLLAALARRLFDSKRAGIAAALAGALFLPFATYASQLLSEQLFFYCITLALLFLEIARQETGDRRQGEASFTPSLSHSSTAPLASRVSRLAFPGWWLLGGAAWGLAALARPVGLYALPLLLVWILVEQRGRTQPHLPSYQAAGITSHVSRFTFHTSRLLSRASCLAMASLLLGFVLVVGPWTARNYLVYKQLVIVDTNGGVSFWLGNLLTPEERDLQQVWNETLPNSAIRQQVALQKAKENILADPGLFLARMRYKTVSLWQLDLRLFAANDTRGVTIDDSSVLFALISDIEYIALVVLALVGVWLARPNERNWAVIGWPIYGTLLCAVTLGHPRLRVPLLVAMVVYAALPLAHPRLVWQRLREASRQRRAGLGISILVFALLLYARALIPFAKGQAWLVLQPLLGEQAIQRAVAADPAGYLPLMALGDLRVQEGDHTAALAAYNAAAQHAPTNAPLQLRRIELLRERGDIVAANAVLADIAAVGWDNPQLYAWAWTQQPAPPVERIDIAAPATGVLDGVYAAERDGVTAFRWTVSRARLRLNTSSGETLHLRLRAPRPDTAVAIQQGDRIVATLRVGIDWEEYAVPLLSASAQSSPDIELHAPMVVISADDPYARGVAVAEAYVSR